MVKNRLINNISALLSEASMAEMEGGLLYMLNADGSARMGFTAGAETESSSSLNISPNQISLDTQGLPYSWRSYCCRRNAL